MEKKATFKFVACVDFDNEDDANELITSLNVMGYPAYKSMRTVFDG